jgi:Pentapeptide repeats (8 copies)
MANEEHLAILKKGVKAWNEWRKQNPWVVHPDLRAAKLAWSDLSGADLHGAELFAADLTGVNFRGANLFGASLYWSNLERTNFEDSRVGRVLFADVDPSLVSGLERVRHDAPSSVGVDTIFRSKGRYRKCFCGGPGCRNRSLCR